MPRLSRLFFDSPRPNRWHFEMPQPAAALLDPSNPKWIQICAAGQYTYHGRPAPMTDAVFDQFTANFRTDPAYRPDARSLLGRPSGEVEPLVRAGVYGVVGLNFDHPPLGGPRPACGWLLDVERRPDPGGGPSTYWALTFLGPRAHQGMLAREWSWTSIEFDFDSQDNKGRDVGARLNGCALTNTPFITGMQPIQMSAAAAPALDGCVVWFGPATDVLCGLKEIFALGDDDGLPEVLARVSRLRGYASGGMPVPPGADVGGVLESIRRVLALPTLSDSASIFAELDKLLGALAAETPEDPPMPLPDQTPPAKPTELSRRLSARLSALGSLFFGAQAQPVAADDEPRLVIEAERFFDRAGDVMAQMTALQSAIGAKTPEEMTAKMGELTSLSSQAQELQAKINALLPEVEAAHGAEEKAEGELASQDVAAVMSRLAGVGLAETALGAMRSTLMLQRLGGDLQYFGRFQRDQAGNLKLDAKGKPVTAAPADRQAFRRAATEKFRTEHQIQRADQAGTAPQNYSFANLYAGPGAQFSGAERPQQGASWTGFSASGGQQGAPPPPPAHQGAWTWSRIAALPPAADDNAINRLVDDMIRTELPAGAKPTQAQLSTFFGRTPAILSQLGDMPPQFFSAFRSAA